MTHPFPGGTYRARCVHVVDGDTVDLTVDLGFRMFTTTRFRLVGINCPELHDADPAKRALAVQARTQVETWLTQPDEWPLLIEALKPEPDSFGRWLARIYGAGLCINDELVRLGLAVVFRP